MKTTHGNNRKNILLVKLKQYKNSQQVEKYCTKLELKTNEK